MIFKTANNLYTSTAFRKLRQELMITRASADGILRCEYCHEPIIRDCECIAHHKTEVTAANLNNPEITLNPENLMLVHLACHNKIHDRFGQQVRKVYLIWGSPCSGKSTFVQKSKMPGDLVADIDLIWQALTGVKYEKPDSLRNIAFQLRDALYEQIKTRAGKWKTAYIISSEPRRAGRMRTCEALGAEPIYLPISREEALQRLRNDPERVNVQLEWESYINNYFDNEEKD